MTDDRQRLVELDRLLERTAFIGVTAPVEIEDIEDGAFPGDYPFLVDESWSIEIELHSGQIQNWPGYRQATRINLKLRGSGDYTLVDSQHTVIAHLSGDVPNLLLPGIYAEYLFFHISEDGLITNWLDTPSLHDYAPNPASHLDYKLILVGDL